VGDYPARGGITDLSVHPCFEELAFPYQRYYRHAMQHLEAYDLSKERESIMARIVGHNRQVAEYEKAGGYSMTPRSQALSAQRDKLVKEQLSLWKDEKSFADKLQEVVNNLEDGLLKGECDFERELRRLLSL